MEDALDLPVQWRNPLSWNVRSLVPTLRLREQTRIPLLLHPLTPVLLRFWLGLDPRDPFLIELLDRRFDPLGLCLSTARAVTERRRCLWSV